MVARRGSSALQLNPPRGVGPLITSLVVWDDERRLAGAKMVYPLRWCLALCLSHQFFEKLMGFREFDDGVV
jgi:hypothetical protein